MCKGTKSFFPFLSISFFNFYFISFALLQWPSSGSALNISSWSFRLCTIHCYSKSKWAFATVFSFSPLSLTCTHCHKTMVLYYITDKHTFSFSLAHRLLLLLHSAIRSPSFLRLNIFARLGFSSFSLYFFFLPPSSLVRKRGRAEEARYHVSKLADRQTDGTCFESWVTHCRPCRCCFIRYFPYCTAPLSARLGLFMMRMDCLPQCLTVLQFQFHCNATITTEDDDDDDGAMYAI